MDRDGGTGHYPSFPYLSLSLHMPPPKCLCKFNYTSQQKGADPAGRGAARGATQVMLTLNVAEGWTVGTECTSRVTLFVCIGTTSFGAYYLGLTGHDGCMHMQKSTKERSFSFMWGFQDVPTV